MKKLVMGLTALMFVGSAAAAEGKPVVKTITQSCPPAIDVVEHLDLRDPIHRAAFGRIFDLTLWYAGKEKADGNRESIPSSQRVNDAIESDLQQVEVTGKSPQMMAIYREIRDSRMFCQ